MHDPDATINTRIEDFIDRYQADRERGRVRPLSEYLAQFGADPEAIARHYIAFKDASLQAREASLGTGADRIGTYRVLKELGRGGQGVVYLAEDERLKRKVALKVLTGAAVGSEMQVERFRREAAVTSRLDHPGICGVLDVGTANGTPYIAMRFVDGETLAAKITRTKGQISSDEEGTFVDIENINQTAPTEADPAAGEALKPSGSTTAMQLMTRRQLDDILHLFELCARALHVAHEAGVTHRDIKPGNIMVGKDGKPIILDFGLARDDTDEGATLTRTGDVFGTPAYMSPEQVAGRTVHLDRRSDVYSLGVALYEAVTLQRPFDAPTREGLYQAILTKDPPDPRSINKAVPPDLKVVLETALDKERDRRYQTAEALADDLRRIREREPIRAKPMSALTRVVRWAQRNPMVAVALAVAFVSLSTGLVVALIQKKRADFNAGQAVIAAGEAQANLLDWNRLADGRRLEDLSAEAGTKLWPAEPDRIPAMNEWLGRARALAQRLAEHQAALAALRAHAAPGPAVDSRPTWCFSSAEEQLKHDKLADLVDQLTAFTGDRVPGKVTIRDVEERLEFASTVRKKTIDDVEAAWRQTTDLLAKNPVYRGATLTPQLGLIPLGPDPKSGLLEFADLQTGDPVTRRADGSLLITDDTGLVFVLIPGGMFRMGAQSADPDEVNFDPDALANEGPVQDITLAPYLISKYEMTQGQWMRFTGANPSQYAPGAKLGGKEVGWTNPVEHVSWTDCAEVMRELGYALPTEAQWERAARGGTATRWSCGDDPAKLVACANLADQFSKANGGLPSWAYEAWDDGYSLHAPVGSFAPNDYGLYDVHGNVWEWCRDVWTVYTVEPRPGDGLRGDASGLQRVIRGGGWAFNATQARSAFRSPTAANVVTGNVGFRPSRDVRP